MQRKIPSSSWRMVKKLMRYTDSASAHQNPLVLERLHLGVFRREPAHKMAAGRLKKLAGL